MKEFEKCKEERFYHERSSEIFINFIETNCKTNFNFLSHKSVFYDFTSYVLSNCIK